MATVWRRRRFQLFGIYMDTGQRWSDYIEARTPTEAEALAIFENGDELTIAGVIDVTDLPPDSTDCVDAGGTDGDTSYNEDVDYHLGCLRDGLDPFEPQAEPPHA